MPRLLLGLGKKCYPNSLLKKEKIVEWGVDNFVNDAPKNFSFMSAVRMILLLATTGTEHLESIIEPSMNAFWAEPARRYYHNFNDFRHNPEIFDHVNNRANMTMAIMMKHYDLAACEQVYTNTPLYSYLSEGADRMRAPGGSYFECKDIATGCKHGQGSPAHYIPLWWILGARLP